MSIIHRLIIFEIIAYITIKIIAIEIQLSYIESSELPDTIPSAYRTVEGEFHGATVELNADIEVSLDFAVCQSSSTLIDITH